MSNDLNNRVEGWISEKVKIHFSMNNFVGLNVLIYERPKAEKSVIIDLAIAHEGSIFHTTGLDGFEKKLQMISRLLKILMLN